MSTAATTPPKKTKGEELFLVHLRRQNSPHHVPNPEEDEDDHDYPQPRKRSRSVGEELYSIHLKRSEGLVPDYDKEKDDEQEKDAEKDYPAKKQETEGSAPPTHDDAQDQGVVEKPQEEAGMHLRDGRVLTNEPQ